MMIMRHLVKKQTLSEAELKTIAKIYTKIEHIMYNVLVYLSDNWKEGLDLDTWYDYKNYFDEEDFKNFVGVDYEMVQDLLDCEYYQKEYELDADISSTCAEMYYESK